MSDAKLRVRFEKSFYEEPTAPKTGAVKYLQQLISSVSDRAHSFQSNENHYYDDEDADNDDFPIFGEQCLSLKEINKLVKKYDLDEKNVYFTASFYDDYLCLEVVNVRKMTKEEIKKDYEDSLEEWNKLEARKKEEEEKRIQWEMESLQRRMDQLKKK